MTTKEIAQTWTSRIESLTAELADGTTPQGWIDCGFSYHGADEWREAGAFNPESAKELVQQGIGPSEVSRGVTEDEEVSLGLPYSGYTVAYMFCNGDINIEGVRRLLGNDA